MYRQAGAEPGAPQGGGPGGTEARCCERAAGGAALRHALWAAACWPVDCRGQLALAAAVMHATPPHPAPLARLSIATWPHLPCFPGRPISGSTSAAARRRSPRSAPRATRARAGGAPARPRPAGSAPPASTPPPPVSACAALGGQRCTARAASAALHWGGGGGSVALAPAPWQPAL